MAGELKKDGEDVDSKLSSPTTENEMKSTKKKKKNILSRIWHAVFRSNKDDFEKRLQHITKEETVVLTRIRKRSQNWRRNMGHFILLSVFMEVIAVGYAIMTTRTSELDWKMRALRVLPIFILPGLSFLTYSAFSSLNRMLINKDQKTLERLRAERQAKIDELKEKTNYYITQQLIQRYDPDPAAKAAAASVLASKLGADSGLNVYVGDESRSAIPTGKSSDVELVSSNGLRNRKQALNRASSVDSAVLHHHHEEEILHQAGFNGTEISLQQQQLVVTHQEPTSLMRNDGGWLARLAALLVGEDPTQSYALICGNCHMHNGLARKEEFPYITYYCPHCNALNRPKQLDEHVSDSNLPSNSSHLSLSTVSDTEVIKSADSSAVEGASGTGSPVVAAVKEIEPDSTSPDSPDS